LFLLIKLRLSIAMAGYDLNCVRPQFVSSMRQIVDFSIDTNVSTIRFDASQQ